MSEKEVGKTKSVGYEVGVRKIIRCSVEDIWNFLLSKIGLKIWLGNVSSVKIEKGQVFQTEENIKGEIKVYKEKSHIRLTWKKLEWKNVSTLQIRVLSSKTGTILSFHQENLGDYNQREEMKERWVKVLDKINSKILL
jgi:hypothetical protein